MGTNESQGRIFTSFLIVGGGIAGISCAEQLALELPSEDILLISANQLIKAVVNVKKCSRVLEEFDVEEQQCSTLEAKYPNIRVLIDTVVQLEAIEHKVHLLSGKSVHYKKLCLCAGAVPRVIVPNSPYVIGIRDTHTIQIFQQKLAGASRVVVVGNGGIATEIVYEIEGCEVIWVVRDKSIGATFFDAGAAEFFLSDMYKNKLQEKTYIKRTKYSLEGGTTSVTPQIPGSALGPDWSSDISLKGQTEKSRNVKIQFGCEVHSICTPEELEKLQKQQELIFPEGKGSWPIYARLNNDTVFGCDFIVSATGVVPNTSTFLAGNKFVISSDGGIEVNDQFETSEPDIYAAGDVCSPTWDLSKHWFQMRLWTQARQMGAFAAKCMAANHRKEELVPLDICFDIFTHVTRFFGYKVVLLGLFNGQKLGSDHELLLRMTKGEEYVKVVLQNGQMQGAILIGETDLEETFENLILNQLDLTPYGEDLLNPNVDIEDYFD